VLRDQISNSRNLGLNSFKMTSPLDDLEGRTSGHSPVSTNATSPTLNQRSTGNSGSGTARGDKGSVSNDGFTRIRDPISDTGYAKIAWLMSRADTPDLAIFKKFGELNMFNLFRLQAELMRLQAMFKMLYNSQELQNYRYSMKELNELQFLQGHSPENQDPKDEKKYFTPENLSKVVLDIERNLKAYSKLY
jgi:hypothetical protein